MKTIFLLLVAVTFVFPLKAMKSQEPEHEMLKFEVLQLFENNKGRFPAINDQFVTVDFTINAKNEIVLINVQGDSESAVNFVRKVLAFKKIRFAPTRQLTSYSMQIHLLGSNGVETREMGNS